MEEEQGWISIRTGMLSAPSTPGDDARGLCSQAAQPGCRGRKWDRSVGSRVHQRVAAPGSQVLVICTAGRMSEGMRGKWVFCAASQYNTVPPMSVYSIALFCQSLYSMLRHKLGHLLSLYSHPALFPPLASGKPLGGLPRALAKVALLLAFRRGETPTPPLSFGLWQRGGKRYLEATPDQRGG